MDIEREITEELMKREAGHNRSPYLVILIVFLLVALACAGVVGFSKMRASQKIQDAKKQVVLGDKAVKAGDYEKGISYYSVAIRADKKNPSLLNKRADAYMKLMEEEESSEDSDMLSKAEKDYRKAADLDGKDQTSREGLAVIYAITDDRQNLRTVYEELEEITGDSAYGEKADCTVLGNTSSNLANDGFFLETPEDAYMAGALDGGAISKVGDDGQLENIWQIEKEDQDDEVILRDLNFWDGYIYFLSFSDGGWESDDNCTICRVKPDGSDFSEVVAKDGDDESDLKIDNLKVIDGKMYYTGKTEEEGSALYVAELDGSGEKQLYKNVIEFASDGTKLYFVTGTDEDQDEESDVEENGALVQKADLDGEEEPSTVMEVKEDHNVRQLITYRKALYIMDLEDGDQSQTLRVYRYVDGGDESPQRIHKKNVEGYDSDRGVIMQSGIAEQKITYFSEDSDTYGGWKVHTVKLKDGDESLKDTSASFESEDVEPYYVASRGDRIYFRNYLSSYGEYKHGSVTRKGGDVRDYNRD